MSVLTIVFASLAAFEHFYIFYLESVATHSASTSRVFNMDQEELTRPSVTVLFKNQGIYNALIGKKGNEQQSASTKSQRFCS